MIRRRFKARRPPPPFSVVVAPKPSRRWSLLFLYMPDGSLDGSQRHTLAALGQLDRDLMIVCAAPGPDSVTAELRSAASAVVWKGLSGFDFSAYAIGLKVLTDATPAVDVFVMNDSVYGPRPGLAEILRSARWDLTGFTQSVDYEAHIQTYAFLLNDFTAQRFRRLRQVFSLDYAYDGFLPNVLYREVPFARTASRFMSVGSFWAETDPSKDPTLNHAGRLLGEGFPFLKKSLYGKHRSFAQDLPAPEQLGFA